MTHKCVINSRLIPVLAAFAVACSLHPYAISADMPGKVPAVKAVGPQQVREDIFEFTEKPKVQKEGDLHVITFTSKGFCDATIAVINKEGKVIRHLASGVLGKNAPTPFVKDSLGQLITWDGKTDKGAVAPVGCKVRVSLGLKCVFDKKLAVISGSSKEIRSILFSDAGEMFVFRNESVKIYDREGKYLRSAMPRSGSVPAEKLEGLKFLKTQYGDLVADAGWKGPLADATLTGAPAITPDGKTILFPYKEGRKPALRIFGADGSIAAKSKMILSPAPSHITVGSTGENVFFIAKGGVYAAALSDLVGPEKFGKRSVPVSLKQLPGKEKIGTVSALARGAGDSLLVANNLGIIYQIKPTGEIIKTIKTPQLNKPAKARKGFSPGRVLSIATDESSGSIYAISVSRINKWSPVQASLVKFNGAKLSEAPIILELKLPKTRKKAPTPRFALAVDNSAKLARVWVSIGSTLLRIEDKGSELVVAAQPDLGEQLPAIASLGGGGARMVFDREREELYVSTTGRRIDGTWHRFDGKTGKMDTQLKPFSATDLSIGPDGLIYIRVGFYGKYVVRFDRSYKTVPFKTGISLPKQRVTKWISSQHPNAIYVGGGGSNVWTSGFTVSPQGDIWVCVHEATTHDKEWVGKNAPWAGKRSEYVSVYAKDGSLKHADAVLDTKVTNGLRVDREGNLFVALPHPVDPRYGTKKWPGLATGQTPQDFRAWGKGPGTLLKFASRKDGQLPVAKITGRGPHEGMLWAFDGPSGATGHSCGCLQARWDLDGFNRTFMPFMQIYSIMVADNNGNTILRLGRYGNADDHAQGKVGLVQVRAIAASDSALYIVDEGNGCLFKATLLYEAEETLDLP